MVRFLWTQASACIRAVKQQGGLCWLNDGLGQGTLVTARRCIHHMLTGIVHSWGGKMPNWSQMTWTRPQQSFRSQAPRRHPANLALQSTYMASILLFECLLMPSVCSRGVSPAENATGCCSSLPITSLALLPPSSVVSCVVTATGPIAESSRCWWLAWHTDGP